MKNEYKKHICSYRDSFVVLVPVWYEGENTPSWRKYFIGTKEECKKALEATPDSLEATYEENAKSRYWKMQEILFKEKIGKHKEAGQIRKQYCL